MVRVLLCLALLVLIAHPAQVLGEHIGIAELRADHWSGGVIDNAAFTPGAGAGPPSEPFLGTLVLCRAARSSGAFSAIETRFGTHRMAA